MANRVLYPVFNPIQMFLPDFTRDERYNSKDFEDFEFSETILPWQQNVGYKQPWQKNDSVSLQLQSNVGPVNLILRTCDGGLVDTIPFGQLLQSELDPELYIYEVTAPVTNYEEGDYYWEIDFGGVLTLRSGIQSIKTLHEHTVLAEAKHYEFREDIIFETGFFPSVRVRSTKKFDRSVSKKTVYEDQVLNESLLRAQKYRKWIWIVGGVTTGGFAKGIPDYKHDMLAAWVGCSDFRLDGKSYTAPADSDFEPIEFDNYPMRSWRIDLRERYTRGSRTYENDVPINAQMTVMVNVDSKGLSSSNSGINTAITNVE